MRRIPILCMIFVLPFLFGSELYSQGLLKKLKDKVEDKAVDKVLGGDNTKNKPSSDNTNTNNASDNNTNTSSTRTRPVQNQGGGLSKTAPDVNGSLKSARTALEAKNYADARYSIRQALQAVETEIGQNILKSLPDKADNLPKLADEDRVTSNGIGFAGLMIHRVYSEKDKELSVDIINDAAILSGINMYLNNPGMADSHNNNNMKQVKYKNYPAILQFDSGSGYTLSVPFGQTSVFVVKGVNYKDEAEIMKAADVFDLEKIKTELGEK